jgi:hypothetical protein
MPARSLDAMRLDHRGTARLRGIVLGLLVLAPARAHAQEPRSALPPEARAHNERGVNLILAGNHEIAVDELETAYALMPDPLLYRAGRGKVLGSIRGALKHLYSASGAVRHLCRLRGLLERHVQALSAALGADLKPDDIAGSEASLQEVDAMLARGPGLAACSEPAPVVLPPQAEPPPPAPVPPLHPPQSSRGPGRALKIAGGATIGVGVTALAVMTYGAVMHARTRGEIQRRTADDGLPTAADDMAIQELYARGTRYRALGIVSGVLGGASVVAGAILVGMHRRRDLARITPVLGPGFAGLSTNLRF